MLQLKWRTWLPWFLYQNLGDYGICDHRQGIAFCITLRSFVSGLCFVSDHRVSPEREHSPEASGLRVL